jgi:hypothetical protein
MAKDLGVKHLESYIARAYRPNGSDARTSLRRCVYASNMTTSLGTVNIDEARMLEPGCNEIWTMS